VATVKVKRAFFRVLPTKTHENFAPISQLTVGCGVWVSHEPLNETGFLSNTMTFLRHSGPVGHHMGTFPVAEGNNPAITYWPRNSRNGKTGA